MSSKITFETEVTVKFAVLGAAFLILIPAGAQQSEGRKAVRGWLSDEGCARGRASGGLYTGTNPDCAKECVSKGKKIVLVLTDEKQILNISNQDAARSNIGDQVEVTGNIDPSTQTLHIASLKMLERGRAQCSRPRSEPGRHL